MKLYRNTTVLGVLRAMSERAFVPPWFPGSTDSTAEPGNRLFWFGKPICFEDCEALVVCDYSGETAESVMTFRSKVFDYHGYCGQEEWLVTEYTTPAVPARDVKVYVEAGVISLLREEVEGWPSCYSAHVLAEFSEEKTVELYTELLKFALPLEEIQSLHIRDAARFVRHLA